MLTNGIRVLNVMRQAGATIVGRPEPHSFNLLESRVSVPGIIPLATATTAITSSPIAQPSSLVKNVMLSANRVFHRYSAFNPDNRVDPVTGNFAPGTYAVPESEVPTLSALPERASHVLLRGTRQGEWERSTFMAIPPSRRSVQVGSGDYCRAASSSIS